MYSSEYFKSCTKIGYLCNSTGDLTIYAIRTGGDIILTAGVSEFDWRKELAVSLCNSISTTGIIVVTITWDNGERITRRGLFESVVNINTENTLTGQEIELFPLGRLLIDESILNVFEKKSNNQGSV